IRSAPSAPGKMRRLEALDRHMSYNKMAGSMNTFEAESMHLDERPYSAEWYARLRQTLGDAVCKQLGIYALPDDFVLSVVIHVYNEEKTLRDLVLRVAAVPIRKEIILVDDCSRDRSLEVMQALAAELQDD